MTKTVADTLITSLGRRKSGITAKDLAEKTGLKLSSVQSTLRDLEYGGRVQVVGQFYTGKRGRPANLYAQSS